MDRNGNIRSPLLHQCILQTENDAIELRRDKLVFTDKVCFLYFILAAVPLSTTRHTLGFSSSAFRRGIIQDRMILAAVPIITTGHTHVFWVGLEF